MSIAPFYEIGCEDMKRWFKNATTERTLLKIFTEAGVKIKLFGKRKVVTVDDMYKALEYYDTVYQDYISDSDFSKEIDQI